MKKLSLAVVFVLVAVACGDTGSGSFDPEAGFTQGSEGELRTLAYAYQPASQLVYGYSMDMNMNMSADLDVPDSFDTMAMGMSMAGSMAYDISAGADEGTVVISVRPSIAEFSVSEFTIDGETMPDTGFDYPAAAGIDEFIPTMTVTLDAKGDVLSMQVGDVAVPSELLGSFGGSGFGDPSGMSLMGTLFGPELPVEEVRVGATWTTTDTQEVPFAGEVTVVTRHEIIGEENRGGRDTFVIRSVAEMSPLTMNFADMLKAFQDPSTLAALGMSADDLDMAQLEAELFEEMDFDFTMTFTYDKLVTTTWLDYSAGVTAATDGDMNMTMKMTMDSPEGSGDMIMDIVLDMSMVLIEDGAGV